MQSEDCNDFSRCQDLGNYWKAPFQNSEIPYYKMNNSLNFGIAIFCGYRSLG